MLHVYHYIISYKQTNNITTNIAHNNLNLLIQKNQTSLIPDYTNLDYLCITKDTYHDYTTIFFISDVFLNKD